MTSSVEHSYRGRTVLVVGLGVTGRAVARVLGAAGAVVRVAERRPAATLPAAAALAAAGVQVLGDDDVEPCLAGVELVVPSPGVPADAPLLQAACARGLEVVSELELAARHLGIPIAAVTGTNGKSTTTALLGEMLRLAGARPFVGGNLGTPLVNALDGGHAAAVVEVSSFQLEWVRDFRPRVGVLLNVTEDHLDRYPDFEAYGRTKLRLFARQGPDDVAILNADDGWVHSHAAALAARRVWFGEGAGAAVRATAAAIRVAGPDGHDEVYPLARVRLAGVHNRENMMAAIAAARALDAPPAAVQEALERFPGLPHRLALVRERAGVRWYNDSKGTNPAAVIRSLESFPGRVILLAGGLEKGGDYGVLRAPAARLVTRAILFGAAREMLAGILGAVTAIERADSLAEAVARADAAAVAGDTVLLSPACASYDMFENYADRGAQFTALVEAL
jgi:UDP-N-acetylmuramoylalanine--D-glutamate ligase